MYLLPAKFDFTGKRRLRQGRDFEYTVGLPTTLGSLVSYDFDMIAKHKEQSNLMTFTCLYTSDTTRLLSLSIDKTALLTTGNYVYELVMTDLTSFTSTLLEGELQLSDSVIL